MDAPLVTKLLLGVGAGLAAELLFEFALPGLAHRVQQVWWIRALSGAGAPAADGPEWADALLGRHPARRRKEEPLICAGSKSIALS